MIKIPLGVDMPKIFCGKPLAFAPNFDLADNIGFTGLTSCVLYLNLRARNGFSERARLVGKVFSARIAHENDTDFGRAIHAADLEPKRLFNELFGCTVDRFAGERHFFKRVLVLRCATRIFHHSVVRRRG